MTACRPSASWRRAAGSVRALLLRSGIYRLSQPMQCTCFASLFAVRRFTKTTNRPLPQPSRLLVRPMNALRHLSSTTGQKDAQPPRIVSLATIELDLADIPRSYKPNLDLSSVKQLWIDFAEAAANDHKQLSGTKISALTRLAVYKFGPESNPYKSLMWILTALSHLNRRDLVGPVLSECIFRFADRLSVTELLDIAKRLGCFDPTEPQTYTNGLLCWLMFKLAYLGRSVDVTHVAHAAAQAGIQLAPNPDIRIWQRRMPRLELDIWIGRSYGQSNEQIERLSHLEALARNNSLDKMIETLSVVPIDQQSLYDCIAILGQSATAERASTFGTFWERSSHLLESARSSGTMSPSAIESAHSQMFKHLIRYKLETEGLGAGLSCLSQIRSSGLEINAIYFNIIIDYMFCNDQANDAMSLFDRMRRNGVLPDIETYGIMIYRCSQQNMTLHTFKYYYALQESGLVRTRTIWLDLLNAFVAFRDMRTAEQCFKDMVDSLEHAPTIEHFGRLMSGFLETGQHNAVIKYYDLALEWGIKPDVSMYRILNLAKIALNETPAAIMSGYREQIRHIRERIRLSGIELLGKVGDVETHVRTRRHYFYYHSLMAFFSRNGRYMEACETMLQDMISLNISPLPVYGLLICGYADAYNMHNALDLFKRCKTLIRDETGYDVNHDVKSTTQKSSVPEELRKLYRQLIPANVYIKLICAVLQSLKDASLASHIFEEMLAVGHKPRPIILETFVRCDMRAGRDVSARLEKMLDLGIRVNEQTIKMIIMYYGTTMRVFEPAWVIWKQYVAQCGPFSPADQLPNTSEPEKRSPQSAYRDSISLSPSSSSLISRKSLEHVQLIQNESPQPIDRDLVLAITKICAYHDRHAELKEVLDLSKKSLAYNDYLELMQKFETPTIPPQ